jgi:predicted peroxiredoxin
MRAPGERARGHANEHGKDAGDDRETLHGFGLRCFEGAFLRAAALRPETSGSSPRCCARGGRAAGRCGRAAGHWRGAPAAHEDGRSLERGHAMSDTIIFNCTHGKDDAERATLPFVAANVAAASGQRAVVVCTIDAVWLGTNGGADGVNAAGLPPLKTLFDELVSNGGEVWLCSACTKPRGIGEDACAPGASIVGAAVVVEEIVKGAKAVSFA